MISSAIGGVIDSSKTYQGNRPDQYTGKGFVLWESLEESLEPHSPSEQHTSPLMQTIGKTHGSFPEGAGDGIDGMDIAAISRG